MPKVRNRTDGQRLVSVPGFDAVVEPGEVIDAPDFQPAHNPDSSPGDPDYLPIAWPETTWEPVKAGKASAKADDSSGKADG